MKKQLVLTFVLGAVCGGGISTFYFLGNPAEVKVLTRTEFKEVPVNVLSIQNDSREVTKFPDHSPEESVHEADDVGKYDPHADDSVDDLSQMDKFERSMASEQEAAAPPEEAPAEAPVEAPQETHSEEPSEVESQQ